MRSIGFILALAAFYCVTNPESFALPRIATVLIGAWVFVGATTMFVVGRKS